MDGSAAEPGLEQLLALLSALAALCLRLAEQVGEVAVAVAVGVLNVGLQAECIAQALLGEPDEVVVLVLGAGDLSCLLAAASGHVPLLHSSEELGLLAGSRLRPPVRAWCSSFPPPARTSLSTVGQSIHPAAGMATARRGVRPVVAWHQRGGRHCTVTVHTSFIWPCSSRLLTGPTTTSVL